MLRKSLILLPLAIVCFIISSSCKSEHSADMIDTTEHSSIEIKGDSMLYGLTCDGTTDSVIVIWHFGGDPMAYDIVDAKHDGKVIGQPAIGDWVGIMRNPSDTLEATMVINLDQLKGTWTYPVMPVMKELQNMSPRMQRRMEANMPDSVKETFLVPREYGFTLKRSHVATPVGNVMRASSLEDNSPVQYPEVRPYKEWYVLNGKLLLVSGARQMPGVKANNEKPVADEVDTLEFVFMNQDSLILMHHNQRYGFHRKENARTANAEAQKMQAKQDSMRMQ